MEMAKLKIAGIIALAMLGIAGLSLITVAPPAFVHAYRIPSASMEDTLKIGDRLLAGRLPKDGPKRGDIVVKISSTNRSELFVRRVVALAGDRIRIVNRVLYRNGEQAPEPYAKFILSQPDVNLDNFPAAGEFVVPPAHVFLLGDNRENSLDDRFTGPTPVADIVGKALFVYAGTSSDVGRRIFRPLSPSLLTRP